MEWLEIQRGSAPLIVSLPHTGTEIPPEIEAQLIDPWRARKDADWHIQKLYDFAHGAGATVVRTTICRTVIDVNRDPNGRSLYPGQATTELCATTTFDGEDLYRRDDLPQAEEVERRKAMWFDPYHKTLEAEIDRLLKANGKIVLYDAHSIRSRIPRLFMGELPQFNIGTNDQTTCHPDLGHRVERLCTESGHTTILNGRFKGGWTTRHYGRPAKGVHAIQMELACRGYMEEPADVNPTTWPSPYNSDRAGGLRPTLEAVLRAALDFATL